jgi:hypothetical protein
MTTETTPASILATLTTVRSGTHTHFAAGGYFICPTHQKHNKTPVPAGTAVTCTRCQKRHAQLTERAKVA